MAKLAGAITDGMGIKLERSNILLAGCNPFVGIVLDPHQRKSQKCDQREIPPEFQVCECRDIIQSVEGGVYNAQTRLLTLDRVPDDLGVSY
jgi:hypothetical protein